MPGWTRHYRTVKAFSVRCTAVLLSRDSATLSAVLSPAFARGQEVQYCWKELRCKTS